MDLFNEITEMEDFEKNLDLYLKKQKEEVNYNNTKLLISIMSATSGFNSIINLKSLSTLLKKDHNICFIASMFNMTRKISNISKKKIFYNQITIKIRPYYNPDNKINVDLQVHLKLFKNGKIQLCGLRNENDGLMAVKILKKKLNEFINDQYKYYLYLRKNFSESIVKNIIDKLYDKNKYLIDYDGLMELIKSNVKRNIYIGHKYKNKVTSKILNKLINKDLIRLISYNITLINSDFYIGFKINRTNTYNYILNECSLLADYDPCIYQGVLIKFYWNYDKKIQDGKCSCGTPCNGKGIGRGDGECRKITISLFQSGNIIITGKCNRDELYFIYDYIVKLLYNKIDIVKQISLGNDDEKIEKLKRRNISILLKK